MNLKCANMTMEVPCNFLETLKGQGCNLIVMSLMQGWRISRKKTECNLQLTFYWSIFKMKQFGRINDVNGKHPTPGYLYLLFSFLACKRQSYSMHWNALIYIYIYIYIIHIYTYIVYILHTDILYLYLSWDSVTSA